MTQREIDSAVAQRTGEEVREITRRGFTIIDPFEIYFDPEPDDLPRQIMDWDQYELERNVAWSIDPFVASRNRPYGFSERAAIAPFIDGRHQFKAGHHIGRPHLSVSTTFEVSL